jgi:RecA-family ATPase
MTTYPEAGMSGSEFATKTKPNGAAADSFSDVELMTGEIAEPIFIVPGLIPEGLTIVSGRPKMGKTSFVMNIADAVARGGKALGLIDCPQHDVLFLALEDNRWRLQKRRRMMLQAEQLSPVPALRFELEWPRLDEGGIEKLDQECTKNKNLKLIVIDTWKKISPHRQRNANDYEHENAAATSLAKLAAKHQIAIVIIHHSRKGIGSEDFVDDVLGSTGLTGAVDTIIGFRRKRGTSDAEISVTGRDVDECEKGLAGDQTTCLWRIVGEASVVRMSRQRKAILDLLKDGKLRTIKDISEMLGERYDNVRMNCAHMRDDGQLTRVGKTYGLPS